MNVVTGCYGPKESEDGNYGVYQINQITDLCNQGELSSTASAEQGSVKCPK